MQDARFAAQRTAGLQGKPSNAGPKLGEERAAGLVSQAWVIGMLAYNREGSTRDKFG